MSDVNKLHEKVRDAIDDARNGLPPDQDKELLEMISGDVESYLDCLREEAEDADDNNEEDDEE